VAELVLVLEFSESLVLMVVSRMVWARRCNLRASPPLEWGAAMAVVTKSTMLSRGKENFIMSTIDALPRIEK
jgi:hypothetical protein